jgi:ribosome-binding factor A
MNTQNLEYLQTNLKYFGFGDKLNEALEKNIKEKKAEFQLKVEIPHFNNKMDYTLHFKKSSETDMYFFNRYDAALQNGKPELDKVQAFYVNKGHGITAKEAFNLLEGRSVFKELINKDGEKYNAWLKLDFGSTDQHGNYKVKQFSEQYGYNLEKTLANFPIKELGDPEQKKQLISSLEKGNVQQVTVNQDGKEAKYYIEAVPQFKNINVYNQKMHTVRRQNIQDFKINETPKLKPDQKTAKKQDQKKDEDGQPKQKQSRKRKLSA